MSYRTSTRTSTVTCLGQATLLCSCRARSSMPLMYCVTPSLAVGPTRLDHHQDLRPIGARHHLEIGEGVEDKVEGPLCRLGLREYGMVVLVVSLSLARAFEFSQTLAEPLGNIG